MGHAFPVRNIVAASMPLDLCTVADSTTHRQRTLLHDLAWLLRQHAGNVAAADETLANECSRVQIVRDEALRAAEAAHSRQIRSVDAEHKAVKQRLAAKYQERTESLEKTNATELQAFVAQTNQLESKAKARLEERMWLAETMLESANKKGKQEFEASRQLGEVRLKDLNTVQVRAAEQLARGRYAPLPVGQPRAEAAADPLAASASAFETAVHELDVLEHRAHPFVLNAGFAIGAVLLAAAAGGIGAAFMGGGAVAAADNARQIGLYAGAAGGGAIVVMLLLRVVLRSRVPAAAAALASTLATSRSLCELGLGDLAQKREAIIAAAKVRREEELSQARQEANVTTEQVQARRQVEEPALRRTAEAAVQALKNAERDEVAGVERSVAEHKAAADAKRAAAELQANTEHDAAVQAARQVHEARSAELASVYSTTIARLSAEQKALVAEAEALCPAWNDPSWERFTGRDVVPEGVVLGSFDVSLAAMPGGIPVWPALAQATQEAFTGGALRLPLMLDIAEKGSLLLQHGAESRAAALATLNNAMLRLMTTFPPAKARFTIIDPVGLGQSFAAFTHLADLDEQLINDKVWTDPRHIEQRLAELTEHMETVIQKYLRNEFATIQEYNTMAGEVAEPFRFLVLADFPTNISEQAAKRLASIITSGPRCGVFTLVAFDARAKPAPYLPVAELQKASMWLRFENGAWVRQDEELKRCPLSLEQPPEEARCTALLKEVGVRSKELGKVRVPFEMVAPRNEQELWSMSSKDEVRVPLGRAGATKLQYLTLGQGTAQHALIAGRTGSGKSTLLHVIITNLGLWYSPDEIELYLVDFKKGVEFKAYAMHELPHARVIAVESEREFGLSVLRRLDAELTRRGQLFRDRNVQDVAGWRRSMAVSGGEPMPRILFIVDEFQEFFVEDDKLAQEASLLLDRLVRQGRAFGMHVILGSQTLGGAYSLARSTLGQMAVRVALQCSEADSYLIMSEDNPAPRLLSRPGEAIYNDASGLIEGNSPFQIVWLPEETRESRLADVRRKDAGAKPRQRIVFEGNLPADIRRNHLLTGLLERGERPAGAPVAWLGEAISIKDPTSIAFRRQSAANVLMVGQQEDAANTMMAVMARALGAVASNRLVFIDSTPADSAEYGVLEKLAMAQPEEGLVRFAGPRGAAGAIAAVAAEVQRREAAASDATGVATDDGQIFVFIMGMHRFRDLRKVEDFSFSSDESAPKPDKLLAKILRDGPSLGVHVIAWMDTATSVDRTLERQTAREFEARVLFQMSANDSTNLIDTPAAAHLGRNRALLYREELGTIEKFRPYATLSGTAL